jgi:N-acetyl sugar amidotransferase
MHMTKDRIYCSRCVFHSDIPGISFDQHGVCNYCHAIEDMEREYPNGKEGQPHLDKLVDDMKRAGRGRKYDCILGVSGGCDSSFLLHELVQLGLRPLAVHFDNTWNSEIATHNVRKMTDALDVDLFTIVVNNKEFDDVVRSFFKARIIGLNAATDIALVSTMYQAAEKYGVKYQIDAHSFRTEGISPIGYSYFDSKMISSVVERHGTTQIKPLPMLPLKDFLRWSFLLRLKRVRPMYYMEYDKEQAKSMLADTYGWRWYGGHHLEDKCSAMALSYLQPYTMGIDQRVNGYAALVRSGQMNREEAIAKLAVPPEYDPQLLEYFKKRLNISDQEFERVCALPVGSPLDYETYKPDFERLRPLFWLMYKMQLVPKSFYQRYCKKMDISPRGGK